MKRHMRVILCGLLSLTLCMGMAACTTPSSDESADSSEQTGSSASAEQTESRETERTDSDMTTSSTEDNRTTASSTASKAMTSATERVTRAPQQTDPSSGGNDGQPVRVLAYKQDVDIIRTDADGQRRLVYLKMTNYEGITHKDCVLTYTEDGKSAARDVYTIYLNEKVVYDTIWLKTATKSVSAVLKDGTGRQLWKGTITVQPAAKQTVIPKSTVYNEKTLKPGTVRGVNYYPRYTPWSAWTKQDPKTWDSEFKEISQKLNANAIRTFAECWETDLMLGWCAAPTYLSTLNGLFAAADKYGIHVLFCLYSGNPNTIMSYNQRYVRSIVEPFIHDGRVLGWDLINEIDDKGLSEQDYVDAFCKTCYPYLSEIDPNHLNQIGFAFMLDKALKVGLTFDGPNQSWQYHYYRKTSAENISVWIDMYFKDRPFILGECGDTSAKKVADGAPREYLGEGWQLDVYKTLIPAFNETVAAGKKMLGMFPWTAFDFPGFGGSSGQGEFGLIREDGSLKPAGEYLGAEYAKIKQSRPAQWDK